jgi:hypothetical protein
METKCFACDRPIKRKVPLQAMTIDGQLVVIGSECYRQIGKDPTNGYQPPKGGPKVYYAERE